MIRFDAIIFDFDGVLLESELESSRLLAALLTDLGHPHELEDALAHYVGLSGQQFIDAIERRIGTALPGEFHERMRKESARALERGIDSVAGAADFVESLPRSLPRAIASSSSTLWVRRHLEHLGLSDCFGPHVYSGREHVGRGKPAPDLYLHAANALAVPIDHCVVIEDSKVGATGALASGALVVGLAAGKHCLPGHAQMLSNVGVKDVASSFDEIASLLGLDQVKR